MHVRSCVPFLNNHSRTETLIVFVGPATTCKRGRPPEVSVTLPPSNQETFDFLAFAAGHFGLFRKLTNDSMIQSSLQKALNHLAFHFTLAWSATDPAGDFKPRNLPTHKKDDSFV